MPKTKSAVPLAPTKHIVLCNNFGVRRAPDPPLWGRVPTRIGPRGLLVGPPPGTELSTQCVHVESLSSKRCGGGGYVRTARRSPSAELPGGGLAGRSAGRRFGRLNQLADTATKPNRRNLAGRAKSPPRVPPVHSVQLEAGAEAEAEVGPRGRSQNRGRDQVDTLWSGGWWGLRPGGLCTDDLIGQSTAGMAQEAFCPRWTNIWRTPHDLDDPRFGKAENQRIYQRSVRNHWTESRNQERPREGQIRVPEDFVSVLLRRV